MGEKNDSSNNNGDGDEERERLGIEQFSNTGANLSSRAGKMKICGFDGDRDRDNCQFPTFTTRAKLPKQYRDIFAPAVD